MIKITIPGTPVAQKRPRFFRRGKGVGTYSDQETEAGKFSVLALNQFAAQADKPLTGPLRLVLVAYIKRPMSHYGSGKNSGALKRLAPKWPDKKPDLDNYVKFVLDCLNGVAFGDDAQVCMIECRKLYCIDGQGPRTDIFLTHLDAMGYQ